MCIPLIAQVVSVSDGIAEVDLVAGERVRADVTLHPTVSASQWVLVDRGLIIEVIDAEQAESMIEFYADLSAFWDDQEVAAG